MMSNAKETYLFFFQRFIVQFHVSGEVVLEDSQKNNGQKGGQEQDQHK